MWVSRKKFEALERRVKKLEERTSFRVFGERLVAWGWAEDGLVGINEVVEQLVKKVGLLWQSSVPGTWV
jgi:hypothetical protein